MIKRLLIAAFTLGTLGIQAQTKTTGVVDLLPGMTAELELNDGTSTATLTFTGPSDRWYALQFGDFSSGTNTGGMGAGQDVVYYNGTTLVDAVHVGVGSTPTTDGTNNWSVTSNTVSGTTRTIVATRAFDTGDTQDFTFVYDNPNIDFAFARASSAAFALSNHGGGNRGYEVNVPLDCAAPDAPTATAQAFCDGATVADLLAEGAMGATFSWYTSATGGTALSDATALTTGTYFVSQTVADCESERTSVTVTVTSIVAQDLPDVSVCDGYVLPALDAGNNYYTNSGGTGTMLTAGDVIPSTQLVYIFAETGTVPNCTDESSFEVTITASPVLETQLNQTVCDQYTLPALTLGNYFTGSDGGGMMLAEGTVISSTQGIYIYVESGTTPNCTDQEFFVVTINSTTSPTAEASQSLCDGATVADLDVNVAAGGTINWYTVAAGGTALATTDALTAGNYYVEQTIDGCTSPRTEVTVTLNAIPDAPTGEATQQFEAGDTVADLVVDATAGATITWYIMNAGMQFVEVDITTALTDGGEYYATQTINDCESLTFKVTADEILSIGTFTKNNMVVYPNPVTDVVFISGESTITKITVVNLLGQNVLTLDANATEVKVDMQSLNAGTYFVQVQAADAATASFKVIKK
ncbi:Ig-like domain-containing protein [Flavobacterium litorale]|uniref:T9SS type A sorting domain-containing protein n=1 Tax=Flavobacterium litorale TaxID=2856519 RepID=A0ABX8V7D3_9FLAO|nr:T9SS type A sorting domain-containing protein [Flavobacterium litorale]QYJ68735.1 T9SS type A sorting domain-containing protein [Flavobacterium litorale]